MAETEKEWTVEIWYEGDFDYADHWDSFEEANDHYEGEVEYLRDRPEIPREVRLYAVSKVLLDSYKPESED